MPGVTTAYQTGIHSARPANGAGCVLYSCTTHSLVYRDDGSSWTTFMTLSTGGTTLTTRGDLLTRDASALTRLAIGSADQVLKTDGTDPSWGKVLPANLDVSADNTTANATSGHHGLLPKLSGSSSDVLKGDGTWAAGAGGGLSHSYIGYNTVGGSTENITNLRQIMKKVTLATGGLVTEISVYVKQVTTGTSLTANAGILTDNSGSPELLIARGYGGSANDQNFLSTANGSAGAARWFHVPVLAYLASGDYWLAVMLSTDGTYQVYYDSGSDRYYTNGSIGRMSDSGWTTVTTSSNKYSIRASFLS